MFDPQTALDFVNTRLDRPAGRVESLGDAQAATAWLAEELNYAPLGGVSASELETLVSFRDSAQRLLRSRLAGAEPASADLELINRASAAAPHAEQLTSGWQSALHYSGSGSATPTDLTELISALARGVIGVAADEVERLAECGADDCVVLFLRSDPRRLWHSDRCGNRVRAARNYARQRSGA